MGGKHMKFIIVLTIAALASFSLFAGGQDEGTSEQNSMENTMMKSDSMDTMALVEPFQDFKDGEQAMMLAESKPTVLFFYATWCPTCQAAVEDLRANVSALEEINLLIVDYDNSDDLQMKYGITYQHTFVQIGPDGKEIAKWNGGASEEILMNIKTMEM